MYVLGAGCRYPGAQKQEWVGCRCRCNKALGHEVSSRLSTQYPLKYSVRDRAMLPICYLAVGVRGVWGEG